MNDCIFCKIVDGIIPSQVVYENDKVLAFKDINPSAPVHVLVIPKKHISSINGIEQADLPVLQDIFSAIKCVADITGIKESGYRVVSNCGNDGAQTVFHLHFHVLGGHKLPMNIV